jgi:hypothetical protein
MGQDVSKSSRFRDDKVDRTDPDNYKRSGFVEDTDDNSQIKIMKPRQSLSESGNSSSRYNRDNSDEKPMRRLKFKVVNKDRNATDILYMNKYNERPRVPSKKITSIISNGDKKRGSSKKSVSFHSEDIELKPANLEYNRLSYSRNYHKPLDEPFMQNTVMTWDVVLESYNDDSINVSGVTTYNGHRYNITVNIISANSFPCFVYVFGMQHKPLDHLLSRCEINKDMKFNVRDNPDIYAIGSLYKGREYECLLIDLLVDKNDPNREFKSDSFIFPLTLEITL